MITNIEENFQYQNSYRYRDIIVHIIQIVKHPLQKTKFPDIWYNIYHMLVILVLMHFSQLITMVVASYSFNQFLW